MSVEGKFLSKEISELFWKENLDTCYRRELHGRKCGSRNYSRSRNITLLQRWNYCLFQRSKREFIRCEP